MSTPAAPAGEGSLRVGVLVVAYNAATTLVQTLDRLPDSFRATVDHILLADDASLDDTYNIGIAYKDQSALPLTVVRHERNLGYGGNQKAGYAWAIGHGLDVIVLLHGDGQYAPEVIEDLVGPILAGEADAVFGSRMLTKGGARRGGMPMYKFVGNRILSTFQNAATGLALSEWHSGYRAYRLSALEELPLDRYTNDFDFDTEIILGLHAAGFRIREVPIPTYYGDEICHVNGLRYAKDVVQDVLAFRLAEMGFGVGPEDASGEAYDMKPSPRSSHGVLLTWLSRRAPGRVLDVGCSDGRFGAAAALHGHTVHGLDLHKHDGVGSRLEEFTEVDLNVDLPPEVELAAYDTVVCGDVLEHVADPLRLLADLTARLRPGGQILISVPNFAHWYPRARTALGRFDYDRRGILDSTHLRFFTRRSFERLLAEAQLEIVERDVVGSPVDVLDRGAMMPGAVRGAVRGAARADRAATAAWPTMFGYQFLYRLDKA
jgi:2-polyprenyl-3-methyl-5-hydroxy-6-metoxy-1,4-benzoquinol methylase